MKIAIIGGTGFVGGYVIKALTAAGHAVSVLVRPGSEDKLRQASFWRITPGDLSDDSAIDATLAGCDAVIYSVGLLREFPRQGITYENTQYEGVVRVVASAKRNSVGRFLLLSANGVKMPGTPYQETKLRAEEHLLASGLDATIFRPSVVFGDPQGTMEFATQLHRDMVASPLPAVGFFSGLNPGKGHPLMSPAYAGDVATAISNCVAQESAIGQTYVLGGPDVLSWHEMIRRIAAAVGRKKWIAPMPMGLMKLAATLFGWLPFFPVTRDQLIMLAENNTADPTTLEELAGGPLTSFDTNSLSYLDQHDRL
jgi:NADH dehydrogenase